MAFCKIIELPETQVLIRKDFNEEEGNPSIIIHVEVQSMYFNTTLTYKNEKSREESYESFNKNHAESLYKHFKKIVNDNNSI
ncbi:hypothetical protein ETU09_00635 [Apibacter muscae]|uniref:Uncharacterized protein n=1 Tax=Apibacter muscae TaxID=2509004 RepID=A0A563DK37_9FLAO|nr:hypothetical protein [Apibacter muscae]TWP30540.1 hypothetical protein ETU09_00635 [Apibacter muscae]